MPKSSLYRCQWITGEGYIVYRHCFDTSKCALEAGVMTHREATFVNEAAAQLYCTIRNKAIDRFGSDSLEHLTESR